MKDPNYERPIEKVDPVFSKDKEEDQQKKAKKGADGQLTDAAGGIARSKKNEKEELVSIFALNFKAKKILTNDVTPFFFKV